MAAAAAPAPAPVATAPVPARRRRFNVGVPSKAQVEEALSKAQHAATVARKHARAAKEQAAETLGEARKMDLVWAAGESLSAMTGTVAGSAGYALVDYYADDKWDNYIAGGLVITGLVAGAASLAAGLAVHPRIGTVGLAWSTGWSAVGVSDLVRRGVVGGLTEIMAKV